MTKVAVVSWNIHQAVDRRPANIEATRRFLEEQIRPTVALLQEVAVGSETAAAGSFNQADDLPYGTEVVVYGGRLEPLPDVTTRYSAKTAFKISPRVQGTFAAARVLDLPDVEPFVAISLYGRMAPLYAQTSVLRAVADLIPLFDASPFNRRIVVGGDLNVYDQTDDKVMRSRWTAILALIDSLGLVNLLKLTQPERGPLPGCPCGEPACWHVETFRHRNRPADKPGFFTTDYIFASPELADRLDHLEVVGRSEAWQLSDHCPVVAHFDL
jgi:exonuclease III